MIVVLHGHVHLLLIEYSAIRLKRIKYAHLHETHTLKSTFIIVAPLSDIIGSNFTLYKVHMHAGAIRKLLYDCAYVREIVIYSLKLVDYLPVYVVVIPWVVRLYVEIIHEL